VEIAEKSHGGLGEWTVFGIQSYLNFKFMRLQELESNNLTEGKKSGKYICYA